MRPPPCFRKWGSAARMTRIEPTRLVSSSFSICSSVTSSAAPNKPYPALLTTTSMRPSSANARRSRDEPCPGHCSSLPSREHAAHRRTQLAHLERLSHSDRALWCSFLLSRDDADRNLPGPLVRSHAVDES